MVSVSFPTPRAFRDSSSSSSDLDQAAAPRPSPYRGVDIEALTKQVRHVSYRWKMSGADALEIVLAVEHAQSPAPTPRASSADEASAGDADAEMQPRPPPRPQHHAGERTRVRASRGARSARRESRSVREGSKGTGESAGSSRPPTHNDRHGSAGTRGGPFPKQPSTPGSRKKLLHKRLRKGSIAVRAGTSAARPPPVGNFSARTTANISPGSPRALSRKSPPPSRSARSGSPAKRAHRDTPALFPSLGGHKHAAASDGLPNLYETTRTG